MKSVARIVMAAAMTGLFMSAPLYTPAHAKGCIKGAIVGGVAGHFAHHHTMLGAGAGCLVGHHLAKKHSRMDRDTTSGSGSSAPER